jgi:hypothetical protein
LLTWLYHPELAQKRLATIALASAANPRPDCQRSSFLYTAKRNFNNRRLQKIGLSGQRRTPIPQMEPVRFSRDSQVIRFRTQVNEEFANVLENFVGNVLLHVDVRHR